MKRFIDPLLWPFARLYGSAVAFRNRGYDRDPTRVGRLPVAVVSVGNVTLGGSGKTPVAAAVARELLARGSRVAVVSRGYGRRSTAPCVLVSDGKTVLATCEESGDEPFELARDVPGLAVVVGPDRLECGRKLLDALGPHALVLDDGFQHRRLHRDLDLVCVDSGEAVPSLRLLPLGRLREPLSSLARADAVVLTRVQNHDSADELRSLLSRAAGREIQTLRSRNRLTGLSRVDGPASTISADELVDRPVGVLLGVARPERVLDAVPGRVVYRALRRDHHWWRGPELRSLAERAKRAGAEALLTTGKDAVKMRSLVTEAGPALALPIFAMQVEAEILDREAFRELLARLPESHPV